MILAAWAVASALEAAAPAPGALWDTWPKERFVEAPAACLRHAELVSLMRALAAKHPGRVRLDEIGRSAEGRPIHLLAVGTGDTRVMLWSQMHGDEPSATPALLDLADHFLRAADPESRAVLDRLTLLMVPMLNPDGTERRARRNAQGIDVNRDALTLATPEGRLLKEVRDRYRPLLGFNLHDQDRRTTIGDTGRLATIALLSVAGDPQGTVTEGRMRAKRVSSAIVSTLQPFIGASIARYDEDWSPRAFGDNLTAWGTPVVLVESGGLPPDRPLTDLTRLNFVALVTVLRGLAADDLAGHDPALYEGLTRNREDGLADVIVRGGRILQGGLAPYRADLAFDLDEEECSVLSRWGGTSPRENGGSLPPTPPTGRRRPSAAAALPLATSRTSRIVEIGDARFLAAGREVDATGAILVPALTASVRGLGARRWLTARAFEDLARLGVGQLRWHVQTREVGAAQAAAAALAGPGRPAIAIVAAKDAPSPLVVTRAPATPVSRALADVLRAVGYASPAASSPNAALAPWAAPAGPDPPPVRLTRDAPASFLVLRGGDGDSIDAARLQVDAVYVDGRALDPLPAR